LLRQRPGANAGSPALLERRRGEKTKTVLSWIAAAQYPRPDSGAAPFLGSNESRVAGVGPEVGFIIPGASVQTYLNLKAYWEFDAQNRASGWNGWATLSFSPSAPAPPAASHPIITK
jgi:hypothetical protein